MYYMWNSGLIKINIRHTFKRKRTQSQCIWGIFLFYWYVKWVVTLLQGHKNWMALHGWTVHTCFLYKRIPNTEVVWFFSPFHIGQRKVETRILSTFVDNVNWEKKQFDPANNPSFYRLSFDQQNLWRLNPGAPTNFRGNPMEVEKQTGRQLNWAAENTTLVNSSFSTFFFFKWLYPSHAVKHNAHHLLQYEPLSHLLTKPPYLTTNINVKLGIDKTSIKFSFPLCCGCLYFSFISLIIKSDSICVQELNLTHESASFTHKDNNINREAM